MGVISIDLAYTSYAAIGIAILALDGSRIQCRFEQIPRSGLPESLVVADYVVGLCSGTRANILLIDGPQGWKDPDNGLLHSRICERTLNTPAKTGLPGNVKPANYCPFVQFLIDVFAELVRRGWNLFSGVENVGGTRTLIESFPLSAWRALQIPSLPAKQKARPAHIESAFSTLCEKFPLVCPRIPNHDELQAMVAGMAGLALEAGHGDDLELAGKPPRLLDGSWREGFIVNLRADARMSRLRKE
jgi:hypothetical protein